MKYTYEVQCEALEYLVQNSPHDLEKFERLYNLNKEGEKRAKISLEDIIFSEEWNTDEKVYLVNLYKYSEDDFYYQDYENDTWNQLGIDGFPLIDQCIRKKNFTGFEAMLCLGVYPSLFTIQRIITYIKDPKYRYDYCKLLTDNYKDGKKVMVFIKNKRGRHIIEVESLCDLYPRYREDPRGKKFLDDAISPMREICATQDIELIKLFLPTVKDINSLFRFAINTQDSAIVKQFIAAGADVNYQCFQADRDKNIDTFKTPIKIAIDNNDLQMIIYLNKNGARLHRIDYGLQIDFFKQDLKDEKDKNLDHPFGRNWGKYEYYAYDGSPLEYAINSGITSILYRGNIPPMFIKDDMDYESEIKKRMRIVRYLYENGAKFSNGEIDYTDLICFAIKSDDFDATRYFFEEAKKHKANLNFKKIISYIHQPGQLEINDYYKPHYRFFDKNANEWFLMCEKYSAIIDSKNHHQNIIYMLKMLFKRFVFNDHQYNEYRDTIIAFSKKLSSSELKTITDIIYVDLSRLKELAALGYDINCTNDLGENLIMYYMSKRFLEDLSTLDELLELGVNPNYINPKDGSSALSYAIMRLKEYGFEAYLDIYNREAKRLVHDPEEIETEKKAFVKRIIDISNDEVINSEKVREAVRRQISPGYSQIIYNDLLDILTKRGLKMDDGYFCNSISTLEDTYGKKYISNPWEHLWNTYRHFSNFAIGRNYEFPKIEYAQSVEYESEDGEKLYALILKHLNRCFITSRSQITNPDEVLPNRFNRETNRYGKVTRYQAAQDVLIDEIKRYIGNLDGRYIIKVLDSLPIIDMDSLNRNKVMIEAINAKDEFLSRELIARGVSIVQYDSEGHDITATLYDADTIAAFSTMNSKYNPNQELESLLEEIGCKKRLVPNLKKDN